MKAIDTQMIVSFTHQVDVILINFHCIPIFFNECNYIGKSKTIPYKINIYILYTYCSVDIPSSLTTSIE